MQVAHVKSRHGSLTLEMIIKFGNNKKEKQMKELKTILGGTYDIAVALGKKLGYILNDAIDELIPQSGKQIKKKGGGK